MKSVLCNKGYIINKKKFSDQIISNVKSDLKVKPFVKGNYGRGVKSFKLYIENEEKLCMPKYYGLEKFGIPEVIDENKGLKTKIKFKGKLRDYQEKIMDVILPRIRREGGGLISIPPGKGKTCLGIYIATKLKLKTLVIVHKTFLVDQWKDRIAFFSDAKVGMIQQKKVDVEGKDIVIGMLQSICSRDYEQDILEEYGLIIVDECHHIAARVFSKALKKVTAKHIIGLSATPNREDKLDKVMYWYMGKMLYQEKQKINQDIKIKIYKYDCKHKDYRDIFNRYTKSVQLPSMITNVCNIPERNDFIINLINETKKKNIHRKILILSGRLDQLDFLKSKIDSKNKYTTSKYIGGMKKQQLKEAEDAEIIFSTYEMSSEGLDIPSLNTVFMISPRSNVEQSVGRILRKEAGKYLAQPLVVDIVDKLKVFTAQGYKRRKFYKNITNYKNIDVFKLIDNEWLLEEKKEPKNNDLPVFTNKDDQFLSSSDENSDNKNECLFESDSD